MRPLPPLLAALLLAPLLPAAAFHDPAAPVLEAVPFEDDAWRAWRVHAPAGARLGAEAWAVRDNATVTSLAVHIHRVLPSGGHTPSFTLFLNVLDDGVAVHVRAPEPLPVEVSHRLVGETRLVGAASTFTTAAAGEWLLVATAGSDGALLDGTFQLIGGAGSTLLGATGGDAIHVTEPEFEGGAALGLRGTRVRAPDVSVVMEVQRTFDVQGELFGVFQGFTNTGRLAMGWDGPQGAGGEGGQHYPFRGAPAGSYTFRVDEHVDSYDTSAVCFLAWERCGPVPVFFAGADVTLP